MRRVLLPLLALATAGCGSVLFYEDFEGMPPEAPPGAAATGTLMTAGLAHVLAAPRNACPSSAADSQWVRLVQPPPGLVQAELTRLVFSGDTTITFVLCLAPTDGDFSFDILGRSDTPLMHIDFMQDGTVRQDDVPSPTLGNYNRSGPISVIATVRESNVVLAVVSRGATVNATLPHSGLRRIGFESVKFSFPTGHSGSAYIDFIRVAEKE